MANNSTSTAPNFATSFKNYYGVGNSANDAYRKAIQDQQNYYDKTAPTWKIDTGGYKSTDPTATTASPTITAPAPYTPGAMPQSIDIATALQQAKARLNPTYDALRGKAEQSFSKQKEQNPQLLAARHGMSGTRGGRRQSVDYGTTQAERQEISNIEGQRLTAQEQLAQAIQDQDNERQMQAYTTTEALKQKQYDAEYQKYKDAVLSQAAKEESDYTRALKQLLLEREDADKAQTQSNWERTFSSREKAQSVADAINQRKLELDELRTKYDISKPYYKPNSSGSKAPTATERLEAYRKGYVDFGIRQLGVIPYNAEAPYNAFRAVQSLMNQQLADTGLKNTDYNDILKQVALAVGYEMPDKKGGGTDEEELMKMLGITAE